MGGAGHVDRNEYKVKAVLVLGNQQLLRKSKARKKNRKKII